jgi:hypothetical protein
MKKLKDPDGPKGEERRKLLETIEKQAGDVEGLAHEYARIRGKNRENPSFSTVAGAERYHSARGIESLARQMTQEIKLVRETARETRREAAGPADSNTQINAGSGRQNPAAEPEAATAGRKVEKVRSFSNFEDFMANYSAKNPGAFKEGKTGERRSARPSAQRNNQLHPPVKNSRQYGNY